LIRSAGKGGQAGHGVRIAVGVKCTCVLRVGAGDCKADIIGDRPRITAVDGDIFHDSGKGAVDG